jgi:lysine-specific demethylase 3
MCDIQTIDRMADPASYHTSMTQQKPSARPYKKFPEFVSPSSSLIRSASQPVLAGQKPDLDHILSVISRDTSVQNLPELTEEATTPVDMLKKTHNTSILEEDYQKMPVSLAEDESFVRSSLAKSMPMLHKAAAGYSHSTDFQHDFSTPSSMDQDFRNTSSFYSTDTHPLTMYRGFQSEINLAKPSVHDRDYLDFYRDSSFPNSQSMTSLLSSDFDSDDSHDERLLNGEFPGKRSLSGREGNPQAKRRGRGRPRLTEEEKQRRKELRDRGLMRKNKKRRTRDEMIRDKIERQQNPKQRGRKKGCKRGTVKDINGVLINLGDLQEGDEMLQVAPCCSFVGVGPCQECWPNKMSTHQNCRFVEFRRLRVSEVQEESVRWETAGFAGKEDVKPEHLAHWIPLRTGYSGMDDSAAYVMLKQVAQLFINIVEKERTLYLTLRESQANWNWKRAVGGVRELCDVCYTTLFNFHFVCPNCGFAVCLDCYNESDDGTTENGQEQSDWPKCVTCGGQPHLPKQFIPTYIIPNDILWELTESIIHSCPLNGIPLQVPPQLSDMGVKTIDNGNKDTHLLPKSLEDYEPFSLENTAPHDLHLAPCAWLCNGRLLQLLNPTHHHNVKVFESKWSLGEPVVISNVQDCLNQLLWTPQSFNRDFGSERVDLVDCRSGLILPDVPAQQFWIGFENVRHRLRDQATDEPMLLKLKDWPPTEDFSEKLPRRFEDIMQGLPLGDYTRRDGKLNMVSSLPSHFVKPDMGPKMYIAYGSPYYPTLGTTNLHLDMSDAVNVLVYANTAEPVMFEPEEEQILEMVRQECCPGTVERIQHSALRVGAIWHIFHSSDAGKIRQFIKKVQVERGIHSFPRSDPIHDQRMYLTAELRQRLELEYGVQGWAIAQCVGDAVFIPAGAPHQVRNICSCIKIAEDFVSPQHIPECLKLTEEFRHLSDLHNNHEDKLQVRSSSSYLEYKLMRCVQ